MRRSLHTRLRAAVAAAVAGAALAVAPTGALAGLSPAGLSPHAPGNRTDAPRAAVGVDSSSAIVRLSADPLATSPSTRPAPGKKIDFSSDTVRSARAALAGQRNDLRQWLRAHASDARIVGEYDVAINAVAVRLNGTPLDTLRQAPHVTGVSYEALYTPLSGGPGGPAGRTVGARASSDLTTDPDLSLINALGSGHDQAGASVEVAVVDTGIDISNPCFDDATYGTHQQLGDTRFTNDKVVVARVFNNKTPAAGYTPEAIQDHGTHVAGTIACNSGTAATVDGVTIPYQLSGVAPRALLGNYNVFPGQVTNARSEDILNALQAAYEDGMDVANMSLGGGASGIQDLLTTAVDNLDAAGMVVAVAAGNSGPGHGTVESPGSAPRALTAGASTVNHYVGSNLTVGGQTFSLASGDFGAVTGADLTGPLQPVREGTLNGVTGLSDACAQLSPASLSGSIALISRGTCTFSTKIRNAQQAGAAAVIVVNTTAGDPIAMGGDGTPDQPTVPAYMLGLSDWQIGLQPVVSSSSPVTGTITQLAYVRTDPSRADIMAAFSSQGPTDVDARIKPDVVAPGVNVLSSIPSSYCDGQPCFAFFQGTSMATPHLAGMAAALIEAHPGWSAEQVRSAVVNTAQVGVLTRSDGTGPETDVQVVGAGLADLAAAQAATVAIAPVSTSFGTVPAGSDQTRSATVRLTNLTGQPRAGVPVKIDSSAPGVSFTVDASSVDIPAGGTTRLTVTMTATRRAAAGDRSATLLVGGEHSELFVSLS